MATHNTEEGASPKELLLEAARRNNTDLLEEVLEQNSSAEFLNDSTDALGNSALHIAAQYGAYDVMDGLLDQEGLEIDAPNRMEGDTPLHKAVNYAKDDKKLGTAMVAMLIDAGADPRIRNRQKQRPIDGAADFELRRILQQAEYMLLATNDIVVDDDRGDGGSGSESD